MDWSNKEVVVNPNLSYTSRDYNSILAELKAAVPSLTQIYNPTEESDPGMVFIKLLAMLGDMLSYNLDNAALEAFAGTVLQSRNAQQIFRLQGYKMKGWKAPRCQASFTNANSVSVRIKRYNTFRASGSGITYTNLSQLDIPAGASGGSVYKSELVQGTPVTPTINAQAIDYYTGEWYDEYSYNIRVDRDVQDNRIYLPNQNVDGSTIVLIDDDSTEFAALQWEQTENLNTLTTVGKYFEFDIDELGYPFIQLPDYWTSRYAITRFKLFYVVTEGKDGEIVDNALDTISPNKVVIVGSASRNTYMDNLHIYNTASTYGNSPETPEEARKSAELYINTMDTLVVLTDFEKATKRLTGVANVKATDLQTDPDKEDLLDNSIKLYVIRKPGYSLTDEEENYPSSAFYYEPTGTSDEMWRSAITEALRAHQHAYYDLDIQFENSVDWIDWTIEGSMWMRQPIPADKNHDILVRVNNNLDYNFSPSKLGFNEAINYVDVIDLIKSSDKMIYHVDLNTSAIQYSRIRRNTNGNPTGKTVHRKWRINNMNHTYTTYYITGLGCDPVPSGSGFWKNSPNRIIKDTGASTLYGLNLLDGVEAAEYEIYTENNVDRIYCWVGSERIDTGCYIDIAAFPDAKWGIDDPYEYAYIRRDNEAEPIYELKEHIAIVLKDGLESGQVLIRNNRDDLGHVIDDPDLITEDTMVYDIMDTATNEWTGRFVRRKTGEIFLVRKNPRTGIMKAYTTKRYLNDGGYITDGFGDPIYLPESDAYQRDPVAKEELTGRYEQHIAISEDNVYDFFLGQDADGNPLLDSIGNEIIGFPIRPDGFHVFIDIDKAVVHDNGDGRIVGTNDALDGYGAIDYETGRVSFKLKEKPQSPLKVIYYKNVVTMARYTQFDPDKFYTQAQFLRYENSLRSLG